MFPKTYAIDQFLWHGVLPKRELWWNIVLNIKILHVPKYVILFC